jgi:hypothetical protein
MAPSVRTRDERRAPVTSAPAASPETGRRPEDVARRAGGPQDTALYRCECGHLFEAAVSASARCPDCGADQTW